jgi:hypothetical protein
MTDSLPCSETENLSSVTESSFPRKSSISVCSSWTQLAETLHSLLSNFVPRSPIDSSLFMDESHPRETEVTSNDTAYRRRRKIDKLRRNHVENCEN